MWTKYDRFNSTTHPPNDDLVWVFDAFYEGVTIGRFVGPWWEGARGNDDVGVVAWATLIRPSPPPDKWIKEWNAE